MGRIPHLRRLILRSRRLPWAMLGLTLLILAGVLTVTTSQTRAKIRAQITGRDREILYAMTRMQMPAAAGADGEAGSLEDPANQLPVILETSRLSGVMGTRLFSPSGQFVESVPPDLVEGRLSASDLEALQSLRPVSRFVSAVSWSQLFLPEAGAGGDGAVESRPGMPVLEVSVPLHIAAGPSQRLVGIAQFVIEGYSIEQEFGLLDRYLWRQALTAFLAGAAILSVASLWLFRRLSAAHRLVAERTENLLQANQELALAAKTSAVGAVTAHLIHGLRNPLAGLQNFVAGLGASVADHPDSDWQQAIAATRRMQAMINDIVGVLREEESAGQYEIPMAELMEIVSRKMLALARERGVSLRTTTAADIVLPNRAANLVALILANLVQNAVEVTPRQGAVDLDVALANDQLLCQVRDQGQGFPAGRQPFAPCQSLKEGGSGIGLAISKQLANHLGAELELRENSSHGCLFVLRLRSGLWNPKTSSITLSLG